MRTGIGRRIQLVVATPLTKGKGKVKGKVKVKVKVKVIQLINTYRCDFTSLKLHDKLGIETCR